MHTSNLDKWIPSPDPSPRQLTRAANGDADAFNAIVERYQQMAYSIAFKILGNHADAEDAVQDAFLKCYRSLKRFRGDAAFSTWFFRLVVGSAVDVRRRERRRYHSTQAQPDAIDCTEEPRTSDLVAALGALPDDYRVPTVLRDVYGLPYQEIATVTGRPLGTVKVMVHRGRAVLRLRLRAAGLGPSGGEGPA